MSFTPTHNTATAQRVVAIDTPSAVLIVDDDPNVREAIALALDQPDRIIHHAADATEAEVKLATEIIDLCLVDVALPDGNGIDLVDQIAADHPLTRSIMITGDPSVERITKALRAGALDFVTKPFDVDDLNQRVHEALGKQRRAMRKEQRLARLRTLCKQLNKARHEISQQVDILCNDLVLAYQDLATQVQGFEMTGDLRAELHGELDLEQVIRRTLEFIINKIGPTNAVIFLPNPGGGYAVGGYVNYSHNKDSHQVFTQHLAENVAPIIAELTEPAHVRDDQVQRFLGHEDHWLAESEMIAMPCCDDEGEVLASILLDRDRNEPYDDENLELVGAIAPLLAKYLVRVINVHHRMTDFFEEDEEDGIIPF